MVLTRAKIILVLLIWLGFILGCHFVESMGRLSEDNSPVTFIARGETDQIWRVSVRTGAIYEVEVVGEEVTGQHDGVFVNVCSQSTDFCPENAVLTSVVTSSGGARLTFTTPVDIEMVYIHVFASIGERGEELGTFSIAIREIT